MLLFTIYSGYSGKIPNEAHNDRAYTQKPSKSEEMMLFYTKTRMQWFYRNNHIDPWNLYYYTH